MIRLQRIGRENTPAFRVIVGEKARSAKKGANEILGHYLPAQEKPVLEVKQDRVTYWMSKGAQPTDTMARLLRKLGMQGMDKYIVRYTKQRKKGEEAAAPAAPAAAAPAPAPEAKKEEAPAEAPKA